MYLGLPMVEVMLAYLCDVGACLTRDDGCQVTRVPRVLVLIVNVHAELGT